MLFAHHDRGRVLRVGHVAAQRLRQPRQLEPSVAGLREDADAGQRPQHAVERPRVRAGGLGQRIDALRAILQQVRDAKLGGDVDGGGDPVGGDHAEELLLRRRWRRGDSLGGGPVSLSITRARPIRHDGSSGLPRWYSLAAYWTPVEFLGLVHGYA